MAASETVAPSPPTPPATATAASSEGDDARLRRLLQARHYDELLAAADALMVADATQRQAPLFRAIALRLLGRVADALTSLAALELTQPQFSRLYEERGQCHVSLRQAPEAIVAFDRAVRLNYALPTSWSMLERLYRMVGRADDAAAASAQAATLQRQPREIVTATGYFLDGDLDDAERRIRAYLLEHGDEVEAMRLLARIGMVRKVYDDAEILLEAVLEIAPDYRAARAEYAEVLTERYRYVDALPEIARLMAEDPANRHYLRSLEANARVGLGEYERAMGIYRELLAAEPADADLHLSLAHVLKTLGRTPEAVESYRRAAASRPGFGDAYWSLANLKTYGFTDAELAELTTLRDSTALTVADRFHVDFALGKALEDRGEYAESFRCYERGNARKRELSRYAPEIIETNTRRQIEVCTRELFAARAGVGAPDTDPIFIVGLPRSGSTLIEQILASHSQVEGTQELANIQHIVHSLRGRDPDLTNTRYPQVLAELDPARCCKPGRALPRDHARLPPRQTGAGAVLHRQDAEQFPAPRADSAHPAERQGHRCAPRAAGLLPQQPQAAVREGPGIHLQRRGHRALLPHLPRADAALGRRAAGVGSARAARGRRRRPRRQRPPDPRFLRTAVRARVP